MAHSRSRAAARQRKKDHLLWLAAARNTLALAAFPLAPFLLRRHFLVLVLLRPSQGVLLVGAFLARKHAMSLVAMVACAIPLQLGAVWLYFVLGEQWSKEIDSDRSLPFLVARVLRPEQIRRVRRVLRARGARLVALARFAIFPTGLLAAAAGASGMERRAFFVADGSSLVVATGLVIGAGYGLGLASHHGTTVLAIVGGAGLVVFSGLLTWYLVRAPDGR